MPWFEHTLTLVATAKVWVEAETEAESISTVSASTAADLQEKGLLLVTVGSVQVESTYEQQPDKDYR